MGNGIRGDRPEFASGSGQQFPLASRWPVVVREGQQPSILDPAQLTFPERGWDPDWRCWLHVAEFAATPWRERIRIDDPPTPDVTRSEIEGLLEDAERQRADSIPEIRAQHDVAITYFDQLLMANPLAYPATATLISVGVLAGQMIAVHFKAKFNRPRPSQVCPALLPPMPVPGHPAYPSGHALQSHLIAQLVSLIRPDMEPSLLALAARVTRNRELAGFHYPSDGKAGRQAASGAFSIMRDLPGLQAAVAEAKCEWPAP